jgi:rfaE bifunctional protein kinase chain/domain
MTDRARSALITLVRRFGRQRVLVLGDMVADEYVLGRPARISREAPVLILHHTESFVRPGGATNVAYNLSRLGAHAAVVGVVGDDEMGRELRRVLDEVGIDTTCLLADPHRATSTKTRVVGRGTQQVNQQLVRIDRVDTSAVSAELRDRMIESVCGTLDSVGALLVSDYEIGVISPELIAACLPSARERGIAIVVDSHGDLLRFQGVTAATPNQPEAEATLGEPLEDEASLDRGGARLLERMGAGGVLITRGSEGVALYERGRDPYRLPVAQDGGFVVDPNGAGDTVAAVFTLALLAGGSMRQGAYMGNVAGGEVVRRLGAAALTPEELRAGLRGSRLPAPESLGGAPSLQ